jgi:murein DD-endopeptidase MepM/ murein hydrolase activator NlpD
MKKDKGAAVGLVICFVAMIAIVGAITFSNYERKSEGKLAKTEEKNQVAQKEEKEEESLVTQGDKVEAELVEKPEVVIEETPIVQAPVTQKTYSFSKEDMLIWPIDGNVLLNYSMDETVYFSTLDQYKYNPALVIAGNVGQEVKSAEDGKVTAIKTDNQTGVTVTVSLGDGYEAVYGQLGEVCVTQGENITEGDIIGYLGEPTKYYSVEGCNLYFQLLKDGEPVNPLEYLDV